MRKLLGVATVIVLAAISQSALAVLTGVPALTWWQWSAINAPVVAMGMLLVYLTKE